MFALLSQPNSSSGAPVWLNAALVPTAAALVGGAALYSQRSWLVDSLYDYVCRGRGGKPSGTQFLTGNYAPLDAKEAEMFQQGLLVEGVLPKELDGVYMRGGPNPFFTPTHGYHWFDGDGLLHATRIKDGAAAYASHFIRTTKLADEKAAGKATYLKFGDMVGRRGLALVLLDGLKKKLGMICRSGDGVANTALTYHAGRLLSLHEGDLPYQLRIMCDGLVETIGRLQLPVKDGIEQKQFTAHPKIDSRTGEMLFIGYNMQTNPYVKIGVVDAGGVLTRQWSVNLPWPTMMHDMAITENYVVLLHMPLCFDGERMVKHDSLPIVFMPERPARIGLLRRDTPGGDATGKVQWFELPSFMVLHVIHACEEGDGIVKLWGCHFDSITLDLDVKTPTYATPHLYTLDTNTGKGSITKVSSKTGDFPVIHPKLVGYPARWAWQGGMQPVGRQPDFLGIDKLDLSTPVGDAVPDKSSEVPKLVSPADIAVNSITFPEGCYGGEPFYVPRNPGAPTAENEDDGFLLVYIARGSALPSQLHVYDARTMSDTPIAVVTLPQRVPFGFHGMWMSEEQMHGQKSTLA